MSIRIVISDIEIPEDESSREVSERMNEHLAFYAAKHPEFSYEINEDRDRNKVVVKTITLEDNAN